MSVDSHIYLVDRSDLNEHLDALYPDGIAEKDQKLPKIIDYYRQQLMSTKENQIPLCLSSVKSYVDASIRGESEENNIYLWRVVKLNTHNLAIFRLLSSAAVDFHIIGRKTGSTMMHVAVYKSAIDTIKFLAEKGLSIEAQNFEGKTPLSIAVLNGNRPNICALRDLVLKYSDKEDFLSRKVISEIRLSHLCGLKGKSGNGVVFTGAKIHYWSRNMPMLVKNFREVFYQEISSDEAKEISESVSYIASQKSYNFQEFHAHLQSGKSLMMDCGYDGHAVVLYIKSIPNIEGEFKSCRLMIANRGARRSKDTPVQVYTASIENFTEEVFVSILALKKDSGVNYREIFNQVMVDLLKVKQSEEDVHLEKSFDQYKQTGKTCSFLSVFTGIEAVLVSMRFASMRSSIKKTKKSCVKTSKIFLNFMRLKALSQYFKDGRGDFSTLCERTIGESFDAISHDMHFDNKLHSRWKELRNEYAMGHSLAKSSWPRNKRKASKNKQLYPEGYFLKSSTIDIKDF
ncbi:MAG: hypothetical protein CMO81_09420 [Waddliaceae bacterium]|nr:hypothetical protein [Waddliaceae bacterium]